MSEPPFTKLTYIDGRPATITLRRCKIVIQRGNELEERTYDKEDITVGSTAENDLRLEDETVSRNHCRLYRDGDHYLIKDLESTNGTFVNRVRIKEAFLKPDCVIHLGKSEIHFQPIDERVRVVPSEHDRLGDLIGGNQKMREIYSILEKIGPTDATLIVEGETGTGKEVVARTIHQLSLRHDGPFMVFDCGAVPENLIESELFGHEKGAFTGAITTRQGVFELANGGTVFLDELGELALELQPKLLRVLEQREVKRVGGYKPIKVDVRVVAATNRDLEEEVAGGRFREDLFYRLSVVRVLIPPLRDRKEDLPVLIEHFLRSGKYNRNREGSVRVMGVSRAAMERLTEYDWPGNVRELANVVERAVSFADGELIEVGDLPDHIAVRSGEIAAADTRIELMASALHSPEVRIDVNHTFKDAKEQWVSSFEKDYIQALLEKNGNNISHAAREADIDRKYFRKLMKKYGIGSYDAEERD